MLPFAAHGDEAPAAPSVPQGLLDARDQVDATNAYAQDNAPPAVGNHCNATLDVPGIGDTCRTPDGMLRVELSDGSSATIHGLDAPPLSAASYAPVSNARVGTASRADIDCVAADQPHYVLVYAHPVNVADRMGVITPKLQTAAYQMSAFLDAESQSVDPSAGRRMPFICDANVPRVLEVQVPAVGSGGIDFNTLVDNLRVAGGLSFNDPTGNERYAVFVDAASSTGASGTGHVFADDSSAAATNHNNNGGLYAVQYLYDGVNVPVWSTLLHEIGHTMGAVVNDAPHATGIGHCHDDQDIMCYADGSHDELYRSNVCAVEVFDCNRDDYYNPAPAPGSYLATHWNVAGAANRFLDDRDSTDVTAPTQPTRLQLTGASSAAIGLGWGASSDDTGVVSYDVTLTSGSGAVAASVNTARLKAVLTGLVANTTYEARVVAIDTRGNRSAPLIGSVATNGRADTKAPSKPSKARYAIRGKRVVITWNDAKDNVGVAGYSVTKVRKNSAGRSIRGKAAPVRATTYSVATSSFAPGVVYQFQIAARDIAGNVSAPLTIKVRLAKDRKRPSAPRLHIVHRSANQATLAWSKSHDAVGVTRYVVYVKIGSRWRTIRGGSLRPTITTLTIKQLAGHGRVLARIGAFDAAGNVGYSRGIALTH